MGTTTRVLIVLNVLVALFMAAAAVTVFGKQTYWVEQTRKSVDEGNRMYKTLKSENERLEMELKKVTSESLEAKKNFESANLERQNLRKQNTNLTNSLKEKEASMRSINDTIKELKVIVSKKEKRNDELQAHLDQEVRRNSASVKEAEWHQSQAIELASENRELESEMMQLAKSNAELVRRVTLLSTQIEKYVSRYGADPDSSVATAGVAINGRVLQIDPSLDLVILSVGSRDKVEKGMEFVISRGDSYIGKVRIANVYDDMSSAKILPGMTKDGGEIKVADAATTLD